MSEEITHQFPSNGYQVIVARLDSLDSAMEGLKERMTSLEDNVERRLMDTRPIWEQVLLRLEVFDKRFDKFDERFEQIDVRFEQIDARFEQIEARFDQIDERFNRVDTRFDQVDARLDRVEARLDQVEARLEQVDRRLDAVETRLGKVEHEVYRLGKKFRVLTEEILDIQNKHEDLAERVDKIGEDQTN